MAILELDRSRSDLVWLPSNDSEIHYSCGGSTYPIGPILKLECVVENSTQKKNSSFLGVSRGEVSELFWDSETCFQILFKYYYIIYLEETAAKLGPLLSS
jgi:hypothetical protein